MSPHLELENIDQLKSTSLYAKFSKYFDIYYKLYDDSITEITNKMLHLITEKGLSQFEAWNESSQLLITTSKVYINIYVINCFLAAIDSHKSQANQQALTELFELFMLYDICDNFAPNILRVNLLIFYAKNTILIVINFFKFKIIDTEIMTEMNEVLSDLLAKVRINAVNLVDAFDWKDSILC